MDLKERRFFDVLKEEVYKTFSKNYTPPTSFKAFGKEDIVAFQEDLFDKVKTSVSEKWFYTYFKNSPKKLPRIDMLNLLSQYIGYENWQHFKLKKDKSKRRALIWVVPLIILFLSTLFFNKEYEFNFCFIDEDRGQAVSSILNIEILMEGESPVYLNTDEKGCFNFTSKKDKIIFIVTSNYYKTDTIIRNIESLKGDIKVQVDDYAIMLDYYSNKKVKDINTRKKQLNNLIHKNAVIYQVYSNQIGVEIYTKEEFINLLTIPVRSLKNIEFLHKEFVDGKIVKLKFIVR